jgi:AraC-like DNA-binding protein
MAVRSVQIIRPVGTGEDRQSLSVTEFGIHSPRWQVIDRSLPSYALVFVERGSGHLTTSQTGRQTVSAPAQFWLVAGQPHSYGPREGTAWNERWVLFEGGLAKEFERLKLIDQRRPLVRLSDPTAMTRLWSAMHSDMLDHAPLGRSGAAATLHRMAVEMARRQRPSAVDKPSAEMPGVMAALRERAFEDVDMVRLAKEFGMSPATLRRSCIRALGVPPKVFQLRLRLDRAKELLSISDRSIDDIAAEVGFGDSFYFSRLFFNREKCSPSRFRQLNRSS